MSKARVRLRTTNQPTIEISKHLLIVEDSAMILKLLRHVVERELPDYQVHVATTFEQGRVLFEQHRDKLFAGIIDLHLPDALDGEMVTYLLEQDFPTIVLTGDFSEESRENLLKQGVLDYVVKESRYSYEFAVGLIKRLEKNLSTKVLVAEDSLTQRGFIKTMLTQQMYQVFTATDGVEAIEILHNEPGIKLLITDYNMPRMDGFELTKQVRREYGKGELAIIGLSSDEQSTLSARFIKNGANDFLSKPFIQEEFNCRITHSIEELEYLETIREMAYRDMLTNLYNRRYLFTEGNVLHHQCREDNVLLSIAVVDIDFFKKVNDNYGHDAGDAVLRVVSDMLVETAGTNMVVRMGGEEFCILMQDSDNDQAIELLNDIRQTIEEAPIIYGENTLSVTISGGVSTESFRSLDQQINAADKLLYKAKHTGRNKIVGEG